MKKATGLWASAVAACVVVVTLAAPAPAWATPWTKRIDKLVPGYDTSVVVAHRGRRLYSHSAGTRRGPASNQKLLLSMALFDTFGPHSRIPTVAATQGVRHGIVTGDLWVVGRGDPSISSGGGYGASLEVRPTRIDRLARKIKESGIRAIEGGVIADTGYFGRDWNAAGWQPYVPERFAPLPSALAYDGNVAGGAHIPNPEERFARELNEDLAGLGIEVAGAPGTGTVPKAVAEVAACAPRPSGVSSPT